VNESGTRELTVSYDGDNWMAMDAAGNYITLVAEGALILPELPDGSVATRLLFPVEHVLSRAFSLPLANARFVDQDILTQELEEHTAEDAEDWWLAWKAGKGESGVSGMMFGLPEAVREQIDEHEQWRQMQTLGVDIWARLNAQMNAPLNGEPAGTVPAEGPMAVFDMDVSGVFFGVWHGQHGRGNDGFWSGMRRLNWSADGLADEQWPALAENIKRSLHAMGWQNEGEASGATGRLAPNLLAALELPAWQGALVEPADLTARHDANLALTSFSSLNFRHGRWRSKSGLNQLKPWYRSFAISAALAVLWAVGMMWQNHDLDTQLAAQQQRVIQAFHKGLPNEKVMIDALAQLRKAAGGATGGQGSNSATLWLQRLESVQRVYQQMPWQLREISLDHGNITMSGKVKDLQTMNKIREALQQDMGIAVKIRDTDLSGAQVQFRMAW